MTLLVESYIFDKIYVNFLIVGHTHSSIDQYFSVLSGAIKLTEFIGSPITLFMLLGQAHKKEKYKRPTVMRQIIVYYDVNSALLPYLNKHIKVMFFIFIIIYCYSLKFLYIKLNTSIFKYRTAFNLLVRSTAKLTCNTSYFQVTFHFYQLHRVD
jgi:hypothetical protein